LTGNAVKNRIKLFTLILAVFQLMLVMSVADAAPRTFAQRYTTNAKGDITIIGNTSLVCSPTGTNGGQCANAQTGGATTVAPTNNFFTMINVDVDTDATTFNSSTAGLTMPAGSNVLFAGLYWTGTSTAANRNTVLFKRPGTTVYESLTATTLDDSTAATVYYQGFIDVTSRVATSGNGIYTVANVQTSVNNTNLVAGWSLVVVYGNSTLPTRNLSVYDGYQRVAGAAQVDITVSGFLTPPFGAVNTTIGTVAIDGDRTSTEGTAGLQFGPTAAALSPVFNAVNPQNDYFNSTISTNGVNVTTGRNPAFTNTLGYDIDIAKANTPLPNNQTTATIRVSSSGETIDLGVVTLATDIFVPNVKDTLIKSVTDVNGGVLIPGDQIEYVIKFGNTGQDGAVNTVFRDSIPANTTYVPGSLTQTVGTNSGAKTDATGDDQGEFTGGQIVLRTGTGANATVGGLLAPGDNVELRFRVTVNASTPGDTLISNSAGVTYQQQTLGATVTDISDSDPNTAGDQPATIIVASPDLTIAKTHVGNFRQGQVGATYNVVIGNAGPAPTFGTVTVTEQPPAGLTVTALSGPGWICNVGTLACTRADVLAVNGTYPPITVTVDVSSTAPASLTNSAAVACACEGASKATNNTAADPTTISPRPDLTIAKTAVGSFVRGQSAQYLVTVTAAATAGATFGTVVTMTDTLPTGLTLSAVPSGGGWTCTGIVGGVAISCTRSDTLIAGASFPPISIPVNVLQTAPASVTNTADVIGGGDLTSASSSATTPIASSADLQVTKTVNNANPLPGQTVTFTVAVKNNGPSDAPSTVVTDAFPPALTLGTVTASQGAYTSPTWNIGTLASGATATLTISATYNGTPATNTASVTSSATDPNSANNTSSATVPSQVADLSLLKAVSSGAPNVGSNVTFTLALSNAGPDAATNVAVKDLLPVGLTFVSATASQGTYASGTGIWTVGAIAQGANPTLAIVATVTSASPITNVAEVSATDQYDPNSKPNNGSATENDYASITIVPQSADLTMSKSVNTPNPRIGQSVTYTLRVTNNGPTQAQSVTVNESLPSGLTFTSATPSAGSYNNATGLWAIGNMADGAIATLTLIATYTGPGQVTNTATLSSPTPDANPGDNSASATVPSQVANLSLTKQAGSATPDFGGNVTFTVTASNAGPSAATNVKVADALPVGLVFVSSTASTGTYDSATGQWTIATIAAGTTATLTITARVNTTSGVTNVAEIVASDQFDPNSVPGNSSATEDDIASATITPLAADLSINKTADIAAPVNGQTVTYTIRVANAGPSAASGVTVNDLLPTGLTFVSATPSAGTYNNTTGVWNIGALANAANATLTIVTAFNGGALAVSNVAQLTSGTPDPNPTNNASQVTVRGQVADLGVTKALVVPADITPNLGANVTYRISVSNAGPDVATNAKVTEILPAGLQFVSATPSQGIYAAGSGVWLIGSITTGTPATLDVVAKVIGTAPISNTAAILSSDQFDGNSANNTSATVTITPQYHDLAMTKTVDISNPNIGQNVVFTLTVNNLGPSAATGVVVRDALPAGLTFVSATPSSGTYAPATGLWSGIASIANGSSATINITARFDGPSQIINLASIQNSDRPDPNGLNDSASVAVPSQIADLIITKTSDLAKANPGQNVVFTIKAENTGPNQATNVRINDALPAGLTLVSAVPNQGTYTAPTWNVGTLDNGSFATLTITAVFSSATAVTNTAALLSVDQFDPTASNNSASAQVQPTTADLALAKTVSNPSPNVGSTVTYTITVSNAGADSATGVSINDLLPAGLNYASDTPSQGTYNSGTGVWTVGTIANGANATLAIDAEVMGTVAITNIATVKALDQRDPITTNDTAQVSITPQQADLSITKTVNIANPIPGAAIQFTITVNNAGPGAASSVVVNDPLPTGLTFTSATASVGTFDSATGNWNIGTLANAGSATLTINATYVGPGQVTNVASVTSTTFDPNTIGNSASVSVPSQLADLSVTKTTNNAAPLFGATVQFTVTAANAGPNAATNVEIRDQLPAGLAFVSATPSVGTYDQATGIWAIPSIAANANTTLVISANVTGTAPIANTATVSRLDQADPQSGNNSSSASIVPQAADLRIAKAASTATPINGAAFSYTITVTNSGPSTATNVVVADTFPAAGLTFVNSSASQGAYNVATGQWSIGTLAANAQAVLVINTIYNAGGTPVANTASVTSDLPDPVPSDNTRSVTTPAKIADLSLTKTSSTTTPRLGDNLSFTIGVSNAGPDAASGVLVRENLAVGLTFVSATPSVGTYDAATGIWTVGALNATQAATLTVAARVTGAAPIINTAEISNSDQFDPNSTPNNARAGENDQASVTITPQAADLSISKSVDNASPVNGSAVTYTVIVRNSGPSIATNVLVTDRLPGGLTFSSASPSVGTYDPATGNWLVGTLAANASATLTITGTYIANGVTVTNTATATSDLPDANPLDNTASISIPSTRADISLTKTVNTATPQFGQNITFTITLANAGPDAAVSIVVREKLPVGLAIVSATPSAGGYDVNAGLWTVPTLAANANATLTIVARVDSLQPVTNVAEVVSSGTFDPNSAPNNNDPAENDQASVLITPLAADLSIIKTVDNPAPANGATIAYTLTVSNAGPSAATAVTVNDKLPAGLTFISSTPSTGTYDTTTGVWTVGTLNANSSATLIIRATYSATGNALTNLASVSSGIADPNNVNNVATVTLPNAGPDLTIAKSHNGNFVIGNQGVFNLLVTNIGGAATTGTVTLTDTLPAGLAPVPASGTFNNNGWGCNVAGQIVSCTRADALAPAGAYPALTLTVQVLASAPPTVSNTASVSGGGDVVSTNNSATDVASVALPGTFSPPLGIKRGVASGNVVTWTLVWINNANAIANRVRITDTMPSGSVFVAASLVCTPNGSTTVQNCTYNSTLQRIEVDATIAADASTATTEQAANNELVITFSTALVNISSTSLTNQALANWDANGSGSVADELTANQAPVVTDDPTTSAGGDPTSVAVAIPAVIQTPTLGPVALVMLILILAVGGMYGRKRMNL
jgi:large repetitive protein